MIVRLSCVVALMMAASCGGKKTAPEPAAAAPEPAPPPPAPEPEPATETAVRAPETKSSNIDATVSVTWADGSATKGHLTRVERSEDWFAEKGWTDNEHKLTVTLEGDGTEIEAQWTDLRSIDISYGSKSDVNCSYDSSYTPAMYECVLKTTATAKLADGKSMAVGSRHKWHFEFEGGEEADFYIFKLPIRRQEAEVPTLGDTSQNTEFEMALRNELMEMRSGKVPTRITIQPSE